MEGLEYCHYNEGLLAKAARHNEKKYEVILAREMLGALKPEAIDRVWRAVFEGALFESRSGKPHVARQLFKYLMQHVSWYGPIYFESCKLEERECYHDAVLKIIKRGLSDLPRYGPLWFLLLKIMEREDAEEEQTHHATEHEPAPERMRGIGVDLVRQSRSARACLRHDLGRDAADGVVA